LMALKAAKLSLTYLSSALVHASYLALLSMLSTYNWRKPWVMSFMINNNPSVNLAVFLERPRLDCCRLATCGNFKHTLVGTSSFLRGFRTG
jgi:hypothetical protein